MQQVGGEGVSCSSYPLLHTFTGFLACSSLSSLVFPCWIFPSFSSHNKVRLYLIDKAHIPLTDTTAGPMPGTQERRCWGLQRQTHGSHLTAEKPAWTRKPKNKKGDSDTLIARIQERVIKKPVRKKQVHLLSPLPYRMVNIFDKTSHLRLRRYICHDLQYSFRTFQGKIPSLLLLSPSCPQLTRQSTLATLATLWFLGPAKHTPSSELCTSCPLSGTL